jgi:S1-C subfamily serine protease
MKKLKAKLKKQLKNLKLKSKLQSVKEPALHAARNVTVFVLCLVTALSSALVADRGHKEYLEHVIGDQVLYVESMPDSKLKGSATGFHVKAKSGNVVFITNAHVCELGNDKGMIMVRDKLNSGRGVPRRILEVYEHNDLCAVEPLPGYKGLTVASDLDVGEPVWAIGYPLGESLNISNGRVKDFGTTTLSVNIPMDQCVGPNLQKGQVQFWFFIVDVCLITYKLVQTDIVIYGGNSGSPMLNIFGNVTGVVFAANTRTNWGRSVPLEHLNDLLSAY